MKKKFVVLVEDSDNPEINQITRSNNPKAWINRVRQNLRAQLDNGIGEWAKFDRWAKFREVPLDRIRIRILVEVSEVVL